MGDLGVNGIADLKHEKPPTGPHFCPRAKSLMQKLPIYYSLYENP